MTMRLQKRSQSKAGKTHADKVALLRYTSVWRL